MSLDERLEALTMNLELAGRDIQDLRSAVQDLGTDVKDLHAVVRSLAETVGGLVQMAQSHERRLERLEKS
jgi:hypothetical protein